MNKKIKTLKTITTQCGYQKKEDLYCTLATYDLNRSQHIPFFRGDVVSVHNYQNVNERDRCQWYSGLHVWIFVKDTTKYQCCDGSKRKKLVELGYTLSRLLNVTQEGCKYEGARIKR